MTHQSSAKKEASAASVGESAAELVYTQLEDDVLRAQAPEELRGAIGRELLLLDSFLVTEATRRVFSQPAVCEEVLEGFRTRLLECKRETGSPSFAQQYKSREAAYGQACSPGAPEPAWFEIARAACRVTNDDPVFLMFFFNHAVKRYRDVSALMRDRKERFRLV